MLDKIKDIKRSVRRPVRERGLLGNMLDSKRARRPPPGGDGGAALGPDDRTAREIQHATTAVKAQGGVLREALRKVIRARKSQTRHDAEAELLMPGAIVAGGRVVPSTNAEGTLRKRLIRYAPETLAYRSPWLARGVGFGLFLGGCILNATTYAEFAPSSEDAVTAWFESAGINAAWALGAFQMAGFSFVGYGIAFCLSYALVPKRRVYGTPADADGGDPDANRRIVHGHFSPGIYASFAVFFFAFALLVAYAMARLRIYGTLLDAGAAASAPGSGAAGSLGSAVPGATANPPDQLLVFMVLALLELIATIAAFVTLDPAVPRTVRGLRKNTERELRYTEKRGRKANKHRTMGSEAGLDAVEAAMNAPIRSIQAELEAVERDAEHREANPGRFPGAFNREVPEIATADLLAAPPTLKLGHTEPLAYSEGAPAPLKVGTVRAPDGSTDDDEGETPTGGEEAETPDAAPEDALRGGRQGPVRPSDNGDPVAGTKA